jgi:hypothetical protein
MPDPGGDYTSDLCSSSIECLTSRSIKLSGPAVLDSGVSPCLTCRHGLVFVPSRGGGMGEVTPKLPDGRGTPIRTRRCSCTCRSVRRTYGHESKPSGFLELWTFRPSHSGPSLIASRRCFASSPAPAALRAPLASPESGSTSQRPSVFSNSGLSDRRSSKPDGFSSSCPWDSGPAGKRCSSHCDRRRSR